MNEQMNEWTEGGEMTRDRLCGGGIYGAHRLCLVSPFLLTREHTNVMKADQVMMDTFLQSARDARLRLQHGV